MFNFENFKTRNIEQKKTCKKFKMSHRKTTMINDNKGRYCFISGQSRVGDLMDGSDPSSNPKSNLE